MRQCEDKRSVELIKDDGLNNEVAPLDDLYDAHNVYALLGWLVFLEEDFVYLFLNRVEVYSVRIVFQCVE